MCQALFRKQIGNHPTCPFLTALQIPLCQCRNHDAEAEEAESAATAAASLDARAGGKRLEMRRTGVPLAHVTSWPMESLMTLSQLLTEVLQNQGLMILPLLSPPPPPWAKAQFREAKAPGVVQTVVVGRGETDAESPFPRRGHQGPFWGGFHKGQRNSRRFKSWSLIKKICLTKDGPQDTGDKSNFPVLLTLSQKGPLSRTSVPSTTQASASSSGRPPSHPGWEEPAVA